MFRDEYKKQIEKIRPDETVKSIILEELQNDGINHRKAQAKRTKTVWRIGAVAVACAVVAVTVFLPRSKREEPEFTPVGNDVLQVASYDDIYSAIDTIYQSQKKNPLVSLFGSFANKDAQNEMIEYASDEVLTDGATGATAGSSAQPTDDYAVEVQNGASQEAEEHSDTNTQVEGVDEADIVKTDGKYIYALFDDEVRIIHADKGNLKLVNTLQLKVSSKYKYVTWAEMYLSNGRLCIIAYSTYNTADTIALVIDVSKPEKAEQIGVCCQDGAYSDSRLIGNSLYLISNYNVDLYDIEKDSPETYVPCVGNETEKTAIAAEDIFVYDSEKLDSVYTVVCGYDITNAKHLSTQSIFGGCDAVYCSTANLLTARSCYYNNDTESSYSVITRFSIEKGIVKYVTDNRIDGILLNQFSMDESNDGFRFVTTVTHYKQSEETVDDSTSSTIVSFTQTSDTTTSLQLLDKSLQPQGKIENLAPGERVYSVRFMGDIAYFVTFRETDPLFSADLSDPKNPKLLGQLKIPGFSNFLFPFGDGQLLGIGMEADEKTGATECIKLSMFDISDPANVTEHSKFLVKDSTYATALYDHKASLVDTNNNLIGFTCETPFYKELFHYRVFSFKDGFSQIADIKLDENGYSAARGIVIGNVFYLIQKSGVSSYSIDDFTLIKNLDF